MTNPWTSSDECRNELVEDARALTCRQQRRPQVNIAVCAVFHYQNYVRYLSEAGVLGRFYYSHRLRTGGRALGIRQREAVNFWPKECLVFAERHIFSGRLAELVDPAAHDVWQLGVSARWQAADLLHVLLHGAERMVLRHASREGARVIGEPVNAHPSKLRALLEGEYRVLGFRREFSLSRRERRLAQELEYCDFLLVDSNWIKRSFVEGGFEQSRIVVIRDGVDVATFRRRGSGPRERGRTFRVLCVASITPRKGQWYRLQAWERLRRKDAELALVGRVDPAMRDLLARFEGAFVHVGRVDHVRFGEYYSRASVFVLPSVEDGFGYVVAAALACGAPVVTTENVGAADLIEDGKSGFVVPPRSVVRLAEVLERLYGVRELLARMSNSAAQTVTERGLTRARCAERVIGFYSKVLGAEMDAQSSGDAR